MAILCRGAYPPPLSAARIARSAAVETLWLCQPASLARRRQTARAANLSRRPRGKPTGRLAARLEVVPAN